MRPCFALTERVAKIFLGNGNYKFGQSELFSFYVEWAGTLDETITLKAQSRISDFFLVKMY